MKTEKLNKTEKLKRLLRPADYYRKISEVDLTKLEESDRFYLRSFGIYTHKLAPDRFTLRIRVPAGRIGIDQWRKVGELARAEEAKILVTSRGQLEIHGLDARSVLEFSREIETVGLTAWQTFSDNFRNIVADPLDGLSEDAVVEVYGTVLQMQSLFLKNPDYVGMLPRKFNVAISGNRKQRLSFFGNDLYFALAEREGRYGFNLYVGGKNSEVAKPLDLFTELPDVPSLFGAIAGIYREEGPRESRSRARFFHMIEAMGIEALRERIVDRLGREFPAAGELRIEKGGAEESIPLKDGTFARRYTTRFGELDFGQWREVEEICARHDIRELRLGGDQNLYIPGIPEDLSFEKSVERYGGIVACAGSKYCVYSLMDTKKESGELALERCRKLGIRIGFSGCLKGCARHAFSDIGLVGIRTRLFSSEVERGVRLYLGAEYTSGRRAGRLVLYSVPLRALEAMLDTVALLFERSGYDDFELFAKEVLNRYSEAALAFWLLFSFHTLHVTREGNIVIPDGKEKADEKEYFARLLENSEGPESREIVALLRRKEEYPFREAIVHLERASFSLKEG
ncbi:nitrite/sulfite reductase [Hydrogenimonas sp.]